LEREGDCLGEVEKEEEEMLFSGGRRATV